jgi:hypothetical protein
VAVTALAVKETTMPTSRGKFTDAKNKRQDAKLTKGLTPKEKVEYKRLDEASHKKKRPTTMKQDVTKDKRIVAQIKSKRKK